MIVMVNIGQIVKNLKSYKQEKIII